MKEFKASKKKKKTQTQILQKAIIIFSTIREDIWTDGGKNVVIDCFNMRRTLPIALSRTRKYPVQDNELILQLWLLHGALLWSTN